MARPRAFDEDRVLDAAMRIFWEKGYDATSTRDLCEATGLDRSSVYNAFESKHGLFTRALSRYMDDMNAIQFEILEDETRTPLERIRGLFAAIIAGEAEQRRGGRGIGCLTVNTTVELAGRDEEVARRLDRDLARRLDALRRVLDVARAEGEIASPRDSYTLARYLNAVIAGLRVSAQGGADQAALEAVAATALDAL